MAGMLNPDNFYKIDAFYGDPKDRQLLRLAEFLKGLADKESLNSIPTYRKQF